MAKTFYDVLRVSNGAGQATIRAAYEELVELYAGKATSGDADAQNSLKRVRIAYDVLSNPQKKSLYDKRLVDISSESAQTRRGADLTPMPDMRRARTSQTEEATGQLKKVPGAPRVRAIGTGGVAALAFFAALYFLSPHWTVYRLTNVAKDADSEQLSTYVDFPAVRESLKAQFLASMSKQMAEIGKDNPFAGLGMMMAGNMVNTFVDGMVTPEGLATMLRNAKTKQTELQNQPRVSPSGSASAREPDAPPDPALQPVIAKHYNGLDYFHIDIKEQGQADPALTWVLRRHGLLSWKLTSIRLHALDGK
jgi:curved DNA-binding protein CbpA